MASEELREDIALQDQLPQGSPTRKCFGCGADNTRGLQIKSFLRGDECVCQWTPEDWHCAGGQRWLSGGVIASIIDCHSMWTAISYLAKKEGLDLHEDHRPIVMTRSMKIDYQRAAPLNRPVMLRAKVASVGKRSMHIECLLLDGEDLCAKAELVAVRIGTKGA